MLGVDIGTSATKAVLVDDEGTVRATASRDHRLELSSPGMVEADALDVWEAFSHVVRALGRRARREGLAVRALAISASVDEWVFLDRADQPIGRVILAPDTRMSPALRDLIRAVSPRRIYEITGLPVYPPYAVARIIWLRRRRPAQHRRVTRVLDWAAFIASRLGLPAATDPTIAARTMAWDISAAEWSAELLEAANIQVACFPAVVATGSVIGAIAGAPSRRLDLPAEVALVAGGMDQWLAAVGSGVTDTGQAMVGTGTWEALVAPLGSLPSDRETLRTSGISIGPFVTSAPYAALASQVGGGSLLRWFRGVFAPTTAIATLLQSIPDRPSGLLVLPHAEGSLSPWMDPESRIAIAGLSLETDRRKLLRGVLEGITLELRENVTRFEGAGITVGELRASGGGARSSAWLQLKADILGWPVTEVVVRHNAAFGAALLAGTGVGIFESVAAAAQAHVRTGRVFEPRASFVRAYDEVFDRYRDLYPAFRVARQAARGARLPSVESQPG